MSKAMRAHKFGLTLGGLFGVVHLTWTVLIAIGVAQPLMDFVFKLHMIQPVYEVRPFVFGTAVALIVFTSAVGYVVGYVLGLLWDIVQKKG